MIKTVRLKSAESTGKLYAIDMVTYVTHEVVLQEVGPYIEGTVPGEQIVPDITVEVLPREY